MKVGVNQWALPASVSQVEDVLEIAAELGFDGVELAVVGAGPAATELIDVDNPQWVEAIARSVGAGRGIDVNASFSDLACFRDRAAALRIRICSLTVLDLFYFPLTSNLEPVRERGIRLVKRLIQMASALEAPTVLVQCGQVTRHTPYEDAWENLQRSLDVLVPEAERSGVTLAIENVWGKFLLSPLEYRTLVDRYGGKFVGVYLDVANLIPFGHPEQWVRYLGSRVKQVHFKDFVSDIGNIRAFTTPFMGDVNWHGVQEALKAVGFDGFVVAEVRPEEFFGKGALRQVREKLSYFCMVS